MGSERVIYATDFPHEPTEEKLMADIPEFMERKDLDAKAKANILYHNSKRLYGIK
jgi:predicted TIM-barrel fold metal-dependent hydrolase